MSDRLKIGLIGAGVFAGYHANKLAAHPRVSFVGVMDRNRTAAENLAKRHQIAVMPIEDLFEQSDAVVIASPATTHGAIALQALEANCHCLIEKPVATTAKETDDIIALANSKNLTVQIGHQERLILEAIGLNAVEERPLKIEAVRNSKYSTRGTDTSVTMDLMSHDIDLCTALMGKAPDEVKGQSGTVRPGKADMAHGLLRYGIALARLSASRVAKVSERRMKIIYPSGIVEIDFNAKTLSHTTSFELNKNFAEDERAKDSLGAATDIFVRAVLDKTPVLVSAEEGAIAVRTAIAIDGA